MAVSTELPFERQDDGTFHLTQPFKGVEPESVQITVDGTTYEFSDYQGRATRSAIYPEVLTYDTVDVVGGDGL